MKACRERTLTRSGKLLAVAAASLALVGLLGTLWVPARTARSESREISAEVLQAIRLLLSDDPKEESKGQLALKRLGSSVIPQLRYWVRKVRNEADRVGIVLSELEGVAPRSLPAERLSVNEFFHQKLLECRSFTQKGDYRRALEIADAILLLDSDNPYAWELRRLSRRAKERLVAREVLEPTIDVEQLVYEVGQKPQIMFRILNHDSRVARIRLEKGVLGELDVSITHQSIDGTMRHEERKLRIEVADDVERIIIGPAQSFDHPLEFQGAEGVSGTAVTRVQVKGRFRPTRWTVERKEENISISMNTTEFWIVPAGEKALADRPLVKLTAALVFGKMEPLFVGGQLSVWAAEDDPYLNEKLVDTLVESLEDLDESRRDLAVRFLVQTTGNQFSSDPKLWKEWWTKTKRAPATSQDTKASPK